MDIMDINDLTASEYMFKQHADHFITIFNWLNNSKIPVTGELANKLKMDFNNLLGQITDLNPKLSVEKMEPSDLYFHADSNGISRIIATNFTNKKSIVFNGKNYEIYNPGLSIINDMLDEYAKWALSKQKNLEFATDILKKMNEQNNNIDINSVQKEKQK